MNKKDKREFKPWNFTCSVENLAPPGEKNQYVGLDSRGWDTEITLEQAHEIDDYWYLRRTTEIIEEERCEKRKRLF